MVVGGRAVRRTGPGYDADGSRALIAKSAGHWSEGAGEVGAQSGAGDVARAVGRGHVLLGLVPDEVDLETETKL